MASRENFEESTLICHTFQISNSCAIYDAVTSYVVVNNLWLALGWYTYLLWLAQSHVDIMLV